ncbi:PREDICTED: toll-like receptor 2 [Nanorana parkeri]|uniref:toll-like receptor 2 n=1 Tax=Nanorana parkeri TaxID=125878 RepID=UPI000854C2E8|nr:PREDICTED: toll-like receptor 2 [Nanorana parkeri]
MKERCDDLPSVSRSMTPHAHTLSWLSDAGRLRTSSGREQLLSLNRQRLIIPACGLIQDLWAGSGGAATGKWRSWNVSHVDRLDLRSVVIGHAWPMAENSFCEKEDVDCLDMFQYIGWLMTLKVLTVALPWCQGTCGVSADGKIVTCKGQDLERVPPNLSENLVYLDLSYNNILKIGAEDFLQYPNLHTLNLSFNNISYIENKTFQYNALIRNLSLSNNALSEIPHSSLEDLGDLQILDLSNNFYKRATLGEVFCNLVNLKELSVGGPRVSGIFKDDFAPIINISLNKFALKSKSSLDFYEPGAFLVLDTQILWLDIAVDTNATLLSDMLKDLKNKSISSLRLRNLFGSSCYMGIEDIFAYLPYIDLRDLVFYRGIFNENLLRLVLQNVQVSSVQNLYLLSIDFASSPNPNIWNTTIDNLNLDNLVIQDVTNPDILQFDWTFTWFSKVTNLSITNVNFNILPCDAWRQMTNLVVLNISGNRLLATYLYKQLCRNNMFSNIEIFNASYNDMRSLKTLSLLTAGWPKLIYLDLRSNHFGVLDETCVWTSDIKVLILRDNLLQYEVFRCLPTTVEHLDLSNSHLDQLDMHYFDKATNLTELILSNNKIKFIPSGWRSPNLQVLALEGNSFGVIDQGSFRDLPQLTHLTAGNNPYHCTCDLYAFITDTLKEGSLGLDDWPDNYYCYHPPYLLNTRIEHFSPGRLECSVGLVVAISASVTAFVVIVCMFLCWRFNAPWYIRATCQIIKTKYRSRKAKHSRDYDYHAFISYSYSDADWVRGVLLRHLENSDPPYRVCIHERDFLPGKWIIDNIIENIENSQKIIFILSHNFINSEWCNYELYFAHQRAIGHAMEDVILVVKESVSMEDLPKRFHRLRKILRTKTYLEWPMEESRQPFFWVQLKSILAKGRSSIKGQDNVSLIIENAIVRKKSSFKETATPTEATPTETTPTEATATETTPTDDSNVNNAETGQT